MDELKKCLKCNSVLEEGTNKCPQCEPIHNQTVEQQENVADTGQEIIEQEHLDTQVIDNNIADSKTSEATSYEGSAQNQPVVDSTNGKHSQFPLKKLLIILGSIAIVLIVIIVTILLIFSRGSSTSEQLFYFKDGEIQLLSVDKKQTSELTDELNNETDYISESQILKSENNRYVFYPGRSDGYNELTYYWNDLTKINSKSDQSTRVDSEIHWNSYLTKDGDKFFYIKGEENRLYVYDRKSGDKAKLDDEVEEYYVNEDGDYIVYTTYENDESTLYEMKLKDMTGTKTKIDSGSYIYYIDMKSKSILYAKDGALYLKEYSKERTKVVSDYSYVPAIYGVNSFYYVKSELVTSKLIDLIEDDLLEVDKQMTKPSYPEVADEPEVPNEGDYQIQEWIDSYYGDEQHPETGEWGYWRSKTDLDKYDVAYEAYEKAYADWEKEYYRLHNTYMEAYDNYEYKLERDVLREELENEEYAVTYNKYSLYYVNKGTETLVTSDFADTLDSSTYDIPLLIYSKMSKSENGKQKLSELIDYYGWDGAYDFIDSIQDSETELRVAHSEVYVALEGKEQVLQGLEFDYDDSYRITQNGNIYVLTDYDYEREQGVLLTATNKNGTYSKIATVDEDVSVLPYGLSGNHMYYFKNVKNGNGDLYLEGKMLTSDVYATSLYTYADDDQILYYKEYSTNKYWGTLTLYKNGKEKKISDDATMFVPIDTNTIAFLYDYNYDRGRGDLMLYTGKSKPTLIDSDVTRALTNAY